MNEEDKREFLLLIDLHKIFKDHRRIARIFIKKNLKTIHNLKTRISEIFSIENFDLCAGEHFLPESEDIRILQKDETVLVVPCNENEYALPSSSNISITPKSLSSDSKSSKSKRSLEAITEEPDETPLKKKKKKKKHDNKDSKKLNSEKQTFAESQISSIEGNQSVKDIKEKLKKTTEEYIRKYSIQNEELVTNTSIKNVLPKLQHFIKSFNGSDRSSAGSDIVRLSRKHIDTPIKNYTKYIPPSRITDQYLAKKKINIVKINVIRKADDDNNDNENQLEVNNLNECKTVEGAEELKESDSTPPKNYVKTVIETFEKTISPEDKNASEKIEKDDQSTLQKYISQKFLLEELNEPEELQEKSVNEGSKFLHLNNCSTNTENASNNNTIPNTDVTTSEQSKPLNLTKEYPCTTETDTFRESHEDLQHETDLKFQEKQEVVVETTYDSAVFSTPYKNNLESNYTEISNSSVPNTITQPATNNLANSNKADFIDVSINVSAITHDSSATSPNISSVSNASRTRNVYAQRKISGLASVINNLRESDSLISQESDASIQYVTKRKRIRKRKKKSTTNQEKKVDTPVQFEQKPTLKVQVHSHCPSIHIRFDEVSEKNDETTEKVPKTEVSGSPLTNGEQKTDEKVNEASGVEVMILSDNDEDMVLENKAIFGDDCIEKSPLMKPNGLEPKVGDIVAFQVLKLTESYVPVVSGNIVGKVEIYVPETKTVCFKLLRGADQLKSPSGKFSLKEDTKSEQPSAFEEFSWPELINPRLIFP